MQLSNAGAQLIADFEGFSSRPYRDAVGVWTIGYGSTRGVGPNTPPISEPAARLRLRSEVTEEYGPAVNALHLPLNQYQFDALASFAYNLGAGIFRSSETLSAAVRARNLRKLGDALLLFDKAGGHRLEGLTRRRRAERALFFKSAPSPLRVLGPVNRARAYRLLWHRRRRLAGVKNQDKYIQGIKETLEHEIRKLRGRDGKAPKPGSLQRKQYDVLHRVVNDRNGRI